ncbi:TIGR02265 family protein [Myxococcaceae bacterium GXIMD 01537]
MPSDKADLAARLAAVQPGDNSRGLFINSVLKLVQSHTGPEGVARVKAAAELTLDYADLRSYPVEQLLRCLYAAADELEPVLGSAPAVFFAAGESCMQPYSKGMGALMFGVLGRGDPHKLFSKAQMGYSAAVSYGQRDYLPSGVKTGTLRVRRDMLPVSYHEGILTASLKLLGFTGEVKGVPHAVDRAEYHIAWL